MSPRRQERSRDGLRGRVRQRPDPQPSGLALAVALAFAAVPAARSIEPIGNSMEANARGGADVAVGDSALSQIENPATLTLAPKVRVDGFGELAFIRHHWRGVIDSAVSDPGPALLGNAAISVPLDRRWAVGLAIHTRGGLDTSFRMRHVFIPLVERRVHSDLGFVDPQINLGFRATERLSVGIGLRAEMATGSFSTVLGPADVEFDDARAFGGGFQAGLHYRVRDDLHLGLAYRSPTWCGDLGEGRGTASFYGLPPVSLGRLRIEDFRLPQKVSAGVAWDATDRLKFVGELRWLNHDNSTLGGTTVIGEGIVDLRYPLPLGYRDQWGVGTGAEFKLTERWILSGGYYYYTPAARGSALLPIVAILSEHHATVGLRYEADAWWAGGGYLIAFPATLSTRGWSRIPLGVDYGRGEVEQTQHLLYIGMGLRW